VRPLLVQGPPGPALLEAGRRADALVVGTRGLGGIDRLLLGSVSTYCINHARGPVVVVPASSGESAGDRGGPQLSESVADGAIVVGIDGSEGSQVALRWALSEAVLSGSRLVVVCAYSAVVLAVPMFGGGAIPIATAAEQETDAEAVVSEALDRLGTHDGVEVSTRVVEGQPAKVLETAGAGAPHVGGRDTGAGRLQRAHARFD
jgi:nucleotide-binding universal stress UspA family protein